MFGFAGGVIKLFIGRWQQIYVKTLPFIPQIFSCVHLYSSSRSTVWFCQRCNNPLPWHKELYLENFHNSLALSSFDLFTFSCVHLHSSSQSDVWFHRSCNHQPPWHKKLNLTPSIAHQHRLTVDNTKVTPNDQVYIRLMLVAIYHRLKKLSSKTEYKSFGMERPSWYAQRLAPGLT